MKKYTREEALAWAKENPAPQSVLAWDPSPFWETARRSAEEVKSWPAHLRCGLDYEQPGVTMAAKKKVTKPAKKTTQSEAEAVLYGMLSKVPTETLRLALSARFSDYLDYLDSNIKNEEDYARHETSSYASARADARRTISRLKVLKKEGMKLATAVDDALVKWIEFDKKTF